MWEEVLTPGKCLLNDVIYAAEYRKHLRMRIFEKKFSPMKKCKENVATIAMCKVMIINRCKVEK